MGCWKLKSLFQLQRAALAGVDWLPEAALRAGFSVGYQDAIATKEALAGKSLNDAQRALLMRTDLYLSGKGEGHHNISEIINAVTTFYGDYRNVSVCWEAAVTFSVMSVYGSPPSDEDLARARHGSAGEGCE